MAVIYPAHCRNTTAGAIKQTKRHGYSVSGGVFSVQFLNSMIVNSPNSLLLPNEPTGHYMAQIETLKVQLDEGAEAVSASSKKLVEAAKEASKQMAEVNGKFRAGTEHLGVAIDKFMKVAGRADYEKTVALTESLVQSLERLAALEERGLLEKVMKAMR